MTRKLALLLTAQIVLGFVSSEALAQNDTTLERVRSLDLESLPGPVPTYYSAKARPRAEALQRRVRDAISYFEKRYGVPSPMSLAVLNEEHWTTLGKRGPYGGMSASAAPRVVVVPAFPEKGFVAQFFRTAHAAASSPEAGKAWAGLGVSHDVAIGHVMDAMVLHEVGHVYVNGALGFAWSQHWFNEFMATYMAHTFLQSREPATINMWKAVSLDIVQGTEPSTRNLDEFNRLYAARKTAPQTYGWFYSQVNLGVTAVREQMKDGDWFRELRAAGLDKEPSLSTSELLDRLDRITPGLKQWAEKVEAAP